MSRWRGPSSGRGAWRQQQAAAEAAARAAAVPGLGNSRVLVLQAQLAPLFASLGPLLAAEPAGGSLLVMAIAIGHMLTDGAFKQNILANYARTSRSSVAVCICYDVQAVTTERSSLRTVSQL